MVEGQANMQEIELNSVLSGIPSLHNPPIEAEPSKPTHLLKASPLKTFNGN
jgi:hypothetical protein